MKRRKTWLHRHVSGLLSPSPEVVKELMLLPMAMLALVSVSVP